MNGQGDTKQYDNNMTGVLFINERKDGSERAPDYRGSCEIGGKQYKISGWKKNKKADNSPFVSLAFRLDDGGDGDGGFM